MQIWIYDEEQKCLDEMAKYPFEAVEARLNKKCRDEKVEVLFNTLFTFGLDEA